LRWLDRHWRRRDRRFGTGDGSRRKPVDRNFDDRHLYDGHRPDDDHHHQHHDRHDDGSRRLGRCRRRQHHDRSGRWR
jgi:hypothetical protein